MARYWSISAVPVSAHPSPLVITSFYNEISGGHISSCRCSEEGLCRPSTTPVVYASRTRKEKFSGHDENCQQNTSDLEGSLAGTEFQAAGPAQKRPDHRTANSYA